MKRFKQIKDKLEDFKQETVINALAGVLFGMEEAGENLHNFFQVMEYDEKQSQEVYTRTSVDLKQMSKVAESKEYEELFLELDKIRDTLKTGSDITDAIEERVNLPREECVRLMTSYLLRGKR